MAMMRRLVNTLSDMSARGLAGASAGGGRALPRRCQRFVALAVALLFSCACLSVGGWFVPAPACADDGASEEENLVDPTQRADNSFIYDTTIASLVDQATLYDNRTVQVYGEVIGDLIRAERGGGYWVMLASTEPGDSSSISTLLPEEQANQIDRFGRYGVTGTTLQVRGIYHQACAEHEGLPDIHVTSSAVLAKGVDNEDRFEADDFIPGAVAVGIGLLLVGVYYYVRERSR